MIRLYLLSGVQAATGSQDFVQGKKPSYQILHTMNDLSIMPGPLKTGP
ncbi:MAG: hypothetical protein OS112_09190 [Methanoregula sp.]|nr:MAG: hypothetical protein OS112_09190 [Methanoregula sp.]